MNWKPVVGYEGFYEVSDLGQVRAIFETERYRPGRVLKATRSAYGYWVVNLSHPTKPKKLHYVHRLVLESFVGPIQKGMETRHLDGDPANPCLSNLAIGTCKENHDDAAKHGTVPRGLSHWRYKLTPKVRSGIKRLRSAGMSIRAISKHVKLSVGTVWNSLQTN